MCFIAFIFLCVHSVNLLSNRTSKQQSMQESLRVTVLYYNIVICSPLYALSSVEILNRVISGHKETMEILNRSFEDMMTVWLVNFTN